MASVAAMRPDLEATLERQNYLQRPAQVLALSTSADLAQASNYDDAYINIGNPAGTGLEVAAPNDRLLQSLRLHLHLLRR